MSDDAACSGERMCICMVSDFFFPGMGGVEAHIYMLSQCLIKRKHKVIVISRAYGNRTGVRYMTNGLKVYYIPLAVFQLPSGRVSFPTLFGSFPVFRNIVLRERVQIVHGHQACSSLSHECMMHGKSMGLKVCFTDHSLMGLADASSIHVNKILQFSLRCVDHCICVSHISKENLVLRAGLNAAKVSVIPNAVDASILTPNPRKRSPDRITIVIMSRLVYRKGTVLLVEVLPEILKRHSNVDVIIGGDGPDRQMIEEMIDKYQLSGRIQMLGFVLPAKVRDVLVQGHIFLNCSLTEAFCIAILEAASCGLLVVSTNVGGVPEVLPGDMVVLADPVTSSLIAALDKAITQVPFVNPDRLHEGVANMYSWHNVASRTDKVYDCLLRAVPNQSGPVTLLDRYKILYQTGAVFGKLLCIMVTVDALLFSLLCWFFPESQIDIAPDFNYEHYAMEKVTPSRFGGELSSSVGRSEPSPGEEVGVDPDLHEFKSLSGGGLLDSDEDFDDFEIT